MNNQLKTLPNMIERIFKDIPEGEIENSDQTSFLMSMGWKYGSGWDELLQSKRILIISVAGSGKTYECRAQAKQLREGGQPAFFVELASLANENLCDLLSSDEEDCLNAWLASQSEVATFFLDSIDELKLTPVTFERALKKFVKSIHNQLHRVKVVITTRPTVFDQYAVRELLPIPAVESIESQELQFAKIALAEHRDSQSAQESSQPADWRTVALMPLADDQVVQFARLEGVADPDALLEDLRRRNAQEFARRPQDLIEICADWRMHRRIRTHSEQVKSNVQLKLKPRDDRPELTDLSIEQAIEGASRLALAVLMTRRLTIRHSAKADDIHSEAALDAVAILTNWSRDEIKTLLERPLFGFASYGRVRFHHRSVTEYLAAQRLIALREKGMSFKSLKRLIFAEAQGRLVVRPSKRPLAGWLALHENRVFEILRDHEPAVLLDEGCPESLTIEQRKQALRAYVQRFGCGGWRGLTVPQIQVQRFVDKELADLINQVWSEGVESPDVRELLVDLIAAGPIDQCADIAFELANDIGARPAERVVAFDALVSVGDKRLKDIAVSIAKADIRWPDRVARGAVLRLFPRWMSAKHLCSSLAWLKPDDDVIGGLNWQLPRLIGASKIELPVLEDLRDGLVKLISAGMEWKEHPPHITSSNKHLSDALAAVCESGLKLRRDKKWMQAAVIALRLHRREYGASEPIKSLRMYLNKLDAQESELLFWVADEWLQALGEHRDAWDRFFAVTYYEGGVELRFDRDFSWVCVALEDTTLEFQVRELLLEVAIRLPRSHEALMEHSAFLKSCVADQPVLKAKIEEWLKPRRIGIEERRWDLQQIKQREQVERRKAKDRASWISFWREVTNKPEKLFSQESSWNTAWYMWRAMCNADDNREFSGWNRHFIEMAFGTGTADSLRKTLMWIWRKETPTLPSERPEEQRSTLLRSWQFGLAGVYAEAEDQAWAEKLTDAEAKLAARYVPIEFNTFPGWIDALAGSHPNAVDLTLGSELSWDLCQPIGDYDRLKLLQCALNSSEQLAKIFLPRLLCWLQLDGDQTIALNSSAMADRVRLVAQLIVKYGSEYAIEALKKKAFQRLGQDLAFDLQVVWLSVLFKLSPSLGIENLTEKIKDIKPAKNSLAVTWIAKLFGESGDAVSLNDDISEPKLLFELLCLTYSHVRVADDTFREGSWTPDERDHAERAREHMFKVLLDAKGYEALMVKLDMAVHPLCAYFKDRIIAVAEENWAQEIDYDVFDESQVLELERRGETLASTNEAMFEILKDRLSDLDELLLSDDSPREAWSQITRETIMRRFIARELKNSSNDLYLVDQESVTAEEKETDIRLRSRNSDIEAVVELKIAEQNRSAKELIDTLEDQLVKKYMAAESRRSGALLITLSDKNKKWKHPGTGKKIGKTELSHLLKEEAERLMVASGGGLLIAVHILDLCPRLTTESQARVKG